MKLLRGNADFSAQSHFAAVSKAGGGIMVNSGGIYRVQKFFGGICIFCDDTFTVTGGVAFDVFYGFFRAVDYFDTEDEIQIFASPFVVFGESDGTAKGMRFGGFIL